MKSSNNVRRTRKHVILTGVLGTLMVVGTACGVQEPKEQAPGLKQEKVTVATTKSNKEDVKEEPAFTMKEVPVKIDYSKDPEEILSMYSEEGMSRFKLNYPDTYTMEYALKNIGKEMPEFSGKDLNGKDVTSKTYKGSNYVVNISKSTCEVCEEISPVIQKLEQGKNKIPVVSIYPIDKESDVSKHREKTKWEKTTTALVAEKNPDLKALAVDELKVSTVPTLLFVDETGRISYINIGLTDDILMKDMKEKAFGKEKLYNFVRKDIVKVDKDGNVVKDVEKETVLGDAKETSKGRDK